MTSISNFQIVGLGLSIGILVIILRQQRVGIYNEDLILVSSLLSIISQLFDFLFRLSIGNIFVVPMIFSELACKLSLAFAVSTVVVMAMLLLTDLMPTNKHNKETLAAVIISILSLAVILVTNIECIYENGVVDINGLSNLIAHALIDIALLLVLVISIINFKKTSRLKKMTVGFWCFTVAQGSILNFFVKETQCLGFNITLSLYIIMALAENIENHYNNELESFNYESFNTYITNKFIKKTKLSLLYFYAFNEYDDYKKDVEIVNVIDDSLKEIKKKIKFHVFKTQNNELIMCSTNEEALTECSKRLKEFVEQRQHKIENAARFYSIIINVRDINVSNNYAELLNLFNKYKEDVSMDPLNITYIDLNEEFIKQMNQERLVLQTIDESIATNMLSLTLQPIINSETQFIEHFEVKAFIKNNGIIVNYEEILSKLEKNERFITFCKMLIERACDVYKEAKMKNSHMQGFIIGFLSYQLEDQQLINAIIDAVADKNINPNRLCIKIINLKDIYDKKLFINNVHKLTEFGIKVVCMNTSADEVQLEDLSEPYIDGVIFNHRFLTKTLTEEKTNIIFENAAQLIHKLNKKIFVNGLNSQELIDKVHSVSVDYMQGKNVYKWMDQPTFLEMVEQKGETV